MRYRLLNIWQQISCIDPPTPQMGGLKRIKVPHLGDLGGKKGEQGDLYIEKKIIIRIPLYM
jgi:hypothetical protein